MILPLRASRNSLAAPVFGVLFLAGLSLNGLGAHSVAGSATEAQTGPAVTAADMRIHLEALASDALEGRLTATPGEARAAAYIAGVFERAGLEPAGDAGSFLQDVGARRFLTTEATVVRARTAEGELREYADGVDFRMRGSRSPEGVLRVVRVGADTDPVPAPDSGAAVYLDLSGRDARAFVENLAGGDASESWGLVLTRGPSKPGRPAAPPPDTETETGTEAAAQSRGPGTLVTDPSAPASLRVRGALRAALESGELVELELHAGGTLTTLPSVNVIGRIPARAGSELAGEVVLLSAHFDHLGLARPDPDSGEETPDLVYNGADDDASGVAAVLEIAEALAAGPAPERSLLFLLATGEEQGLIGTRYFLEHPPAPVDSMVLNLNFEMVGRPDPAAGGPGKLWLTGFERSTLGEELVELGLAVVPDPYPDMKFFMRSDNYALAQRGVVAQSLSSYGLHDEYHTVDDEIETLDFDHLAAVAGIALEATRRAALGQLTPVWREGGRPEPRSR